MVVAEIPTPQNTHIAIATSDFAARSKPCDNCGRKIAIAYKYIRGKNMRVCGDCFVFPMEKALVKH